MNKWMPAAALMVVAVAPAQAAHKKSHHVHRHHHALPAPANYPDSVTLDGKDYKVCKGGMQDDCVQPREAGLGVGNRSADRHHRGKLDQHR